MKSLISKSIIIGLSVTGAVVGVGFASGREVVSFFAKYGYWSFLMCFITGGLFVFLSYIIFSILSKEEFIKNNHKNKNRKNSGCLLKYELKHEKLSKKLKNIDGFDVVLFVCELVICSAMFAGIDSLFAGFGISGVLLFFIKVVVLIVSIFYLIYFKNSVHIVNGILTFLLLILCIIIFIINVINKNYNVYDKSFVDFKMIVKPFLFVGMNVLTAYPLMNDLSISIFTKKERFVSSLFIGFFIFVCLLLVSSIAIFFGAQYFDNDMIMVDVANDINIFVGTMYSILVVFGLFTTLISVAFGAVKFSSIFMNKKCSVVVSLVFAYVLSFFGFANIIDIFYPVLGFVCLLFIVVKFVKNQRKNANLSKVG